MSNGTDRRIAVARDLRDEILLHYGTGRAVVAVDGVSTSGGAAIADAVAEALAESGHAAARAHVDGGSETVETVRSGLVAPFRSGGDAPVRFIGAVAGADLEGVDHGADAPDDAVLVVDGGFLLRPELVGLWNYSVFVEVARRSAGDGAPAALTEDERRYLAEVRPRTRAVAIIDATDPDAPVRRFADSC